LSAHVQEDEKSGWSFHCYDLVTTRPQGQTRLAQCGMNVLQSHDVFLREYEDARGAVRAVIRAEAPGVELVLLVDEMHCFGEVTEEMTSFALRRATSVWNEHSRKRQARLAKTQAVYREDTYRCAEWRERMTTWLKEQGKKEEAALLLRKKEKAQEVSVKKEKFEASFLSRLRALMTNEPELIDQLGLIAGGRPDASTRELDLDYVMQGVMQAMLNGLPAATPGKESEHYDFLTDKLGGQDVLEDTFREHIKVAAINNKETVRAPAPDRREAVEDAIIVERMRDILRNDTALVRAMMATTGAPTQESAIDAQALKILQDLRANGGDFDVANKMCDSMQERVDNKLGWDPAVSGSTEAAALAAMRRMREMTTSPEVTPAPEVTAAPPVDAEEKKEEPPALRSSKVEYAAVQLAALEIAEAATCLEEATRMLDRVLEERPRWLDSVMAETGAPTREAATLLLKQQITEMVKAMEDEEEEEDEDAEESSSSSSDVPGNETNIASAEDEGVFQEAFRKHRKAIQPPKRTVSPPPHVDAKTTPPSDATPAGSIAGLPRRSLAVTNQARLGPFLGRTQDSGALVPVPHSSRPQTRPERGLFGLAIRACRLVARWVHPLMCFAGRGTNGGN
jgi:hypothetical protein